MGGRVMIQEVSRITVTGKSFCQDVNEWIPAVLLMNGK